jgi:hypothetical protein
MNCTIRMRNDLAEEGLSIPASTTFSNYDTLDDDLYITAQELEGATQGNDPANSDNHPFCYLTLKDGRSLYFISADLDFDYKEENEQLQQTANELIQKYKAEIVEEGDWWYGTDEHSFNIHCPDEDGWYQINVYKVDPVTGMDNYEWMIDLPRVYLGGQEEKDPLNQDAIEQEAIGHLNLANTIIYNLEGDKYQAIYEQLEVIIKQMKDEK